MDDHLFFPRGLEEKNPKILLHIALPFVNAECTPPSPPPRRLCHNWENGPSFPRKRESSFDIVKDFRPWMPAFAGMTNYDTVSRGGGLRREFSRTDKVGGMPIFLMSFANSSFS